MSRKDRMEHEFLGAESDQAPVEPPAELEQMKPFDPDHPTVLLEDGRIEEVAKGSFADQRGHDWRVRDTRSNQLYEHTADGPNDRWIYRPVNG